LNKEKIILGIDPGTNIMGVGVLNIKGKLINCEKIEIIKLNKLKNHALKLKSIFIETLKLIDTYKPDEVAFEAPFYGKNVQSMLKLGRAQGVSMAASLFRDIPIFEYSPKKIKQSITGNGNASKEQVAGMLKSILNIEIPKYLDGTDGLAVALCHYYQKNNTNVKSSYKNWSSFIDKNKDKII
tara:strand:- start:145 stop:693 length:549 start_codon:yes stop_codon:yes gene_type:complete